MRIGRTSLYFKLVTVSKRCCKEQSDEAQRDYPPDAEFICTKKSESLEAVYLRFGENCPFATFRYLSPEQDMRRIRKFVLVQACKLKWMFSLMVFPNAMYPLEDEYILCRIFRVSYDGATEKTLVQGNIY